ncbi:MAG: hypothetical protein MUD17_11470 [Gemmatimonadaceae bacterium]|jgi:hypothetical protein|nr:hypothetical protein [Gemmatimonadaceae bacterium]
MNDSRRASVSLIPSALSIVIAVVIYRWLPSSSGAMAKLAASILLSFPVFAGGLVLRSPPQLLDRGGARRMLLVGASTALLGAREAARLYGVQLSRILENVYFALLLVLIGAMVWSWRQARQPSPSSTMRSR